jgi:hypothetical protein
MSGEGEQKPAEGGAEPITIRVRDQVSMTTRCTMFLGIATANNGAFAD